MKLIIGLAVGFLSLSVPVMAATECRGLASVVAARSEGATSKVVELLKAFAAILSEHASSQDDCTSAQTVIGQIFHENKQGGRRLEPDKPLDIQQAQNQLVQAQDDTEVRARMESLKSQTTDPKVQLLLDAMVLDSEGYNSARELKMQQLRELLK